MSGTLGRRRLGPFARERAANDRAAAKAEIFAEQAEIRAQRAVDNEEYYQKRLAAHEEHQRLHARPVESAVETIKRLPPDVLTDFLKIVHGRGFDWNAYRTELAKMHREAGLHGM